jgi:histidinol dehydrogenase
VLELLDLRNRRERLERRGLEIDPAVADVVRGIIDRVRADGDDALFDLTLKLDGADLRATGLTVSPEEFQRAEETVPSELKAALDALIERLTDLHRRQLPMEWWDEREGIRFGEVVRAIARAGCYVPGGRADYPSSVAMTVVPAIVAGVEEVVVCTPPSPDGSIHAPVLYTAARAGANTVVKIGGAQAVAALAFGTPSIQAVDRIVGPGNVYVNEAKRQVVGSVGIDGLAGPTELAVVADASADPAWIAADLVAQAEHDPDALAVLVAFDEDVVHLVEGALDAEVARAGRRDVVKAALAHARTVLVADDDQAIEVLDHLAPEHVHVVLANAPPFAQRIRNAGAIFVGGFTPVPFGDYGVASNHVLPTGGTARFSSGLRSVDFVKVSSVVEISDEAAVRLAPEVARIALAEGLPGHVRAVEIRAEGPRPT